MACRNVPAAYAAFDAHSSPLGLDYFDGNSSDALRDSFLVGLHGSTKESLKRGYRVVRLRRRDSQSAQAEDFINGFLVGRRSMGGGGHLKLGTTVLLTDDYAGVVYYIYQNSFES